MIDSGAGCSLITEGILRQINSVTLHRPDKILRDASGNIIKLLGKVKIPVTIKGDKGETLLQET